MIEGVISEEIVPENESWCKWRSFEVIVPLIEHGNDLITLFSDSLFREEKELGFPVDIDENIFSFFDKRIGGDSIDKVIPFFKIEFLSCSC